MNLKVNLHEWATEALLHPHPCPTCVGELQKHLEGLSLSDLQHLAQAAESGWTAHNMFDKRGGQRNRKKPDVDREHLRDVVDAYVRKMGTSNAFDFFALW